MAESPATSSLSARPIRFVLHKPAASAATTSHSGLRNPLLSPAASMTENTPSRMDAMSHWPMSDGHLDSPHLQQKISRLRGALQATHPYAPICRVQKCPMDGRRPLTALTNTSNPASSQSRVLVWRGKVGGVLMDAKLMHPNESSSNLQRRSPAVYSYRIVNQRLSHVAASAPPRSQAYPAESALPAASSSRHQHIAYRFVFTNAL